MGCQARREEREMGDALGKGLQVWEMYESAEKLDRALNIKGGEGGLPGRKGRSCRVGPG